MTKAKQTEPGFAPINVYEMFVANDMQLGSRALIQIDAPQSTAGMARPTAG